MPLTEIAMIDISRSRRLLVDHMPTAPSNDTIYYDYHDHCITKVWIMTDIADRRGSIIGVYESLGQSHRFIFELKVVWLFMSLEYFGGYCVGILF